MSLDKLEKPIIDSLTRLVREGRAKGREDVITGVKRAEDEKGPRYLLEGMEGREFIKMDSNSYLGLSLHPEILQAAEETAIRFGAGPGSVRFIHGTYKPHRDLENRLARFHGGEAAIIFSSAYAAVCGTVSPLISNETTVISDALNHNSIINALRMAKPMGKKIYRHLDMTDLERRLEESIGACRRVIIISDGVFSMRGDHPDLKQLVKLARRYDGEFKEGVITIIDDSHGTGAYGRTGRGTCEVTEEYGVDILISTIGKALGVNGGYAVTRKKIVEYLKESSPFYIYSNPLTPAEAGAALRALEILDSETGRELLHHLSSTVTYFKNELRQAGLEVLKGNHPVVAVMIRDSGKTADLIEYLRRHDILAVGLKYPVVPQGDECIRLQVNACHTRKDIDYVLNIIKNYLNP